MNDARSQPSGPDSLFLARAPTTAGERRAAAFMAGLFGLLLLAVLPWAKMPGPAVPVIVAVFTTGIIIADLATAFLLMLQLEADTGASEVLIACAYLFSALMGIAHILSFPGAVLPNMRIAGGPQLTSYVFSAWRLGFATLMLAAVILYRCPDRARAARRSGTRRFWPSVTAVGAVGLVLLSAAGENQLPTLVEGQGFTALGLIFSWSAAALGLLAAGVLGAKSRGKTVLHLWLLLALVAFCVDLVLSTAGAERFSLGWYAGRASGFASACTLFLVLLVRFAVQQRYALETTRALRERTVGLQVEIARRAEAEERLLHAQKMEAMGQLTGGIAHDFNNLLATILGNLDLLRRRAALDARASRLVDNAVLGVERGRALTSQLLVFSRLQRIALEPVPLQALFGRAAELLPRTLGPSVAVTFDLRADQLHVLGDFTQLELAILNIAINARDAMPGGGALKITAERAYFDEAPDLVKGEYAQISVSDTGSGMAPDVLARAFEPFFTTKGIGRGTGLGLSQVFGLAKRAGGAARIESRPGQGTTVHVILPVSSPPDDADRSASAREDDVWFGTGKVLVIDDDESVREVLVGQLEEIGLSVAQASDGQSGLSMLAGVAPDLLVVDFAMPGMNGAEVAQAARARFPHLPVVFVSGYADTDAISRALGEDALTLRKPFRSEELRAILSEALRPKRAIGTP